MTGYQSKRDAAADKLGEEHMIEVGDIVQVEPSQKMFGGCMVVVTELKDWGIQGYVQSAGVEGQQYIRLKTEQYEQTGGKAVWVVT